MVLIPLILQARDNASNVLQRFNRLLGETNQKAKENSEYWRDANGRLRDVNGRFVALGGSAQQAQGSFGGLSSVITGSILKANLLTGAFTTAVGAVQQGVGYIQGALAQGSQIQLQNIQAASTFSSLTGQSYEQATAFVDKFNAAIAVSAASLPGETEQFAFLGRQITDSLIPAFTDASGVLDQSGLEENLMAITEAYGALSAAGNIDIGGTTMGVSRALAGASFAELKELELFQNNSTLANALEKGLEEAGAESFEDLDLAKRIEIIRAAGESQITSDFKEQAGRSVEGLMQSFQSNIFGPNGVFGVMRDLNRQTDQVESVFASYNESLVVLIGEGGLLTQLSELFREAGLTFDPMLALKIGIDRFNSFLTNVNDRLTNLNEALDEGGSLVDMLGVYAEDLVGDVARSLGLDQDASLSESLSGGLTLLLNRTSLYLSDRLSALGDEVQPFLARAVESSRNILSNIEYYEVGVAIGSFVGRLLGSAVELLSQNLVGMVQNAGVVTVGMIQIIKGFLGGLVVSVTPPIGNAIKNVGVDIVQSFGDMFTQVLQAIKNAIGQIPSAVQNQATSFVRNAAANPVQAGGNLIGGTVGRIATANPIGLAVAGIRSTLGSRAEGQIPSAFASLLSAAQAESRNAPVGASLVVANSSEAIIPRSAVQAIQPRATTGGGRSLTINVGNISSNAADPNAVANVVIQKIQALFEQEYNAQLT